MKAQDAPDFMRRLGSYLIELADAVERIVPPMPPADPLDLSVFSVRVGNVLATIEPEVRTWQDLAACSEKELLSYKNFGLTSLLEVKVALEDRGLTLSRGDISP